MIDMHPQDLFRKLFAFYGPQNWWPGEGFEIAIGAVLTQNTSWSNVEKALQNLKQNGLLNPQAILIYDIEFLKQLIKPAGFFNQKANYLRNLCSLWIKNSIPSRDDLLAVKGIGEETADSILLYLLNKPEFVIDAYTVRISKRIGFNGPDEKSYWKRFYQEKMKKDIQVYNEFHALLVIHAKKYCKKSTPLCKECFLYEDCAYSKK